jgi:hypothetical protein
MDDLDKFEEAFFGNVKAEDKQEEVDENEDDALEPSEDEDAEDQEVEEPDEEDEDPDEADEEDEDEEPEPPKAKKGKKSFKERIDEITAEKYELKRQLRELQQKVESRSNEVKQDEAPTPVREQLSAAAPDPDAKNEDGTPKYALGEFDPKFIRDLTKFMVEEDLKVAREEEQKKAAAVAEQRRQAELAVSWNEKLDKAEEEIPDIRDSITDLVDVFSDLDPHYGDYLAATLMSLDNGPEVMHYLSQNIGEARKIVASGPNAATLAIGRLEAQIAFGKQREEKSNTSKKVSKAHEPPLKVTRGQGGKFAVSGDTDDLDAFEREFFKTPANPFGRRR